ncbi:MAG: S-methyl-5-thioribose-1-phosphate isomerase [Lentisphaerota bacterium]
MRNLKVPFSPLSFKNNTLYLLDQRKLPVQEKWVACRDSQAVWKAIRTMVVRGAPAIGIAAGYGLYLGINSFSGTREGFLKKLRQQAAYLDSSRPTARNLAYAVERIVRKAAASKETNVGNLRKLVLQEAKGIHTEDILLCRSIGKHGADLFGAGSRILTHCNAGGLATSGYGTALAVFYAMKEKKIPFFVYADETRPLLQGARLTAWELFKSKIPSTLICDNMAASIMRAGKIDGVVVGADRIANAVAAWDKFRRAVIVADFGTALTFDVINSRGAYIGGVIAPGLPLMLDYLSERTAMLPHISLEGPCGAIGRTTREAMRTAARLRVEDHYRWSEALEKLLGG